MSAKADKVRFAAIPYRAINDERLTRSHFVVLACIAWHDRMSGARRSGQGAWMSRDTISKETSCHPVNVSSLITDLCKWDYLDRQRHHHDGRKHTYRVIYESSQDADRSSAHNQSPDEKGSLHTTNYDEIGSRTTNSNGKIGSLDLSKNGEKSVTSPPQYISLSEGINFVETTEIDSAEAARLTSRGERGQEKVRTIGEALARLERTLRFDPEEIDPQIWVPKIERMIEEIDPDAREYQWAIRLAGEIYELASGHYPDVQDVADL